MRRLWLLIIVGVLVGLGVLAAPASPACACDCAMVEPDEAAERADAVFAGVVREVDRPWRLIMSSDAPVEVTIEVRTVYKGDVPATVRVRTAAEGASCGYDFVEGGRYLVFAMGEATDLTTGLCDGNRDLARESVPFSGGQPPQPAVPDPDSWPPALAAGLAATTILVAWLAASWWRYRRLTARLTG